jgi:hypothetical protein
MCEGATYDDAFSGELPSWFFPGNEDEIIAEALGLNSKTGWPGPRRCSPIRASSDLFEVS